MGTVVALKPNSTIVGDDYWNDISTGDWATDCQAGRDRADRVTSCLSGRSDRHPAFTRAMRDMVERGRFTGVEVGFFQRLMELATLSGDKDAKTQGL